MVSCSSQVKIVKVCELPLLTKLFDKIYLTQVLQELVELHLPQ